ncbi:MAG TPA: ABC transporter ATP-binding protein, partial [Stellaceae bacterium]|nr:ABC transporter ATP-binding protein [Stellaceae bacterium]
MWGEATQPRLELRGLTKSIGGNAIVRGIDLAVAPGESVVLLGPSGCGKSTTLRMVAGFDRPDGGEIWLDGKLASGASAMVPTEKRHLGMVFQNYAVWPHKNVGENVTYGLAVAGTPKLQMREHLKRLLQIVRLDGMAERFPRELSGGQQQRVALARAIATEPSLLLLDEPLSNLDAALRQEMRLELKELHDRIGATMLYVTHDQEEALVLADRVIVMHKGVIEQAGTPEEIYRRPRTRFVAGFVGSTNLLPGKVEAKDRDAGRIFLRIGAGFGLWGRAHAETLESLREGADAALVVRPEDLALLPAGTGGEGTIPARFKSAVFLGNRYEARVEAAGVDCHAHLRDLGAITGDDI